MPKIPFLHVGQVIENVDDTVWGSGWGESADLTVRLVMRNMDPSIEPDYWVEAIDSAYGREHEVQASTLAPYVS